MNNYPEYTIVNGNKYKINTDFKAALKCQEIAQDRTIGEFERALAIIYTLFGEVGLNNQDDQEKLLEMAIKYLRCGSSDGDTSNSNDKPDMDLIQDYYLIEPSFKSDYGIDLEKEEMHWWKFYRLLNGLTDKCALNRVRELRTFDLSTITDTKLKNQIKEMQKQFALKEQEQPLTEKQQKSVDKFFQLTGIKRKE